MLLICGVCDVSTCMSSCSEVGRCPCRRSGKLLKGKDMWWGFHHRALCLKTTQRRTRPWYNNGCSALRLLLLSHSLPQFTRQSDVRTSPVTAGGIDSCPLHIRFTVVWGKEPCASDGPSETETGDQWGAATLSELAEAVTLHVSPQLRGCSLGWASHEHSRLTHSSEAEQWKLDTVMHLKGCKAPSLFLFWSNRSVSDLSNERHGNLSNAIRIYYFILK